MLLKESEIRGYKRVQGTLCHMLTRHFVAGQRVVCRSFSLSRSKKINWEPSSGRSPEKEML